MRQLLNRILVFIGFTTTPNSLTLGGRRAERRRSSPSPGQAVPRCRTTGVGIGVAGLNNHEA